MKRPFRQNWLNPLLNSSNGRPPRENEGGDPKGISDGAGNSGVIRRLKENWIQEYSEWKKRSLDKDHWIYLWADGIYSGVRASTERLCALVIVGVNGRGERHFLAIEDGMQESSRVEKMSSGICLKDRAPLPAFYDFPAEQWIRIRTTNPIESTLCHDSTSNRSDPRMLYQRDDPVHQ